MKRCLALVLVLLLSLAAAATAGGFSRQTLHVDGKVHRVVPTDVDGDGNRDLIVSYAKDGNHTPTPRLAVFFAADGFNSAALDFALPGDTCLWDVADLDGDKRQELILLRKWSVAFAPLTATAAPKWSVLAKQGTGVLFPPKEGNVDYLDFARDWTGDGALEIAVPDYGAFVFLRAKKNKLFARAFKVRMSAQGWMRVEADPTQTGVGERITTGVELPQVFVVPTGRGNELFLVRTETVTRHALTSAGAFAEKGKTQRFAILTDAEKRAGNMMVISVVGDFNGDGRPDLMFNKCGGGLSTFKSSVQIFPGGEDGFAGAPVFSHQTDGYASMIHFRDLDGDGKKEMYLPHADFGIAQLIRMLTTKKVKLKAQIFRGGPDMYGDKPALTRIATFAVNTDRGMDFRGYPPNFNGDFDGDGRHDLMMSSGDGFGVYRNEGALKFSGSAMLHYVLPAREHARLADLNGDGKSECLFWDTANPAHRGEIIVLLNNL